VTQAYLDHQSASSTATYTHLTRKIEALTVEAVNKTLEELWG
jgi:hypothetical protein